MEVEDYLLKVGVPDKYIDCSIPKLQQSAKEWNLSAADLARYDKIYNMTQELITDGKFGAYLYGCNGAGKTSLAVAMLRDYVKMNNWTVARTTAQEILDYFFDGWKGIRPRYLAADVLLIEEMNKEVDFGKSSRPRIIEQVVKGREEKNKFTLYTANCDMPTLHAKYGDTIFNIIKGTCLSIEFPKVDYRNLQINKYLKEKKSSVR